jgi:hypothetical protein
MAADQHLGRRAERAQLREGRACARCTVDVAVCALEVAVADHHSRRRVAPGRERSQELERLARQMASRPESGMDAGVDAAPEVAQPEQHLLVVSEDQHGARAPEARDARLWIRTVANHVARADHARAGSALRDVAKHGIERLEVRMHVGEDGQLRDPCPRRSHPCFRLLEGHCTRCRKQESRRQFAKPQSMDREICGNRSSIATCKVKKRLCGAPRS